MKVDGVRFPGTAENVVCGKAGTGGVGRGCPGKGDGRGSGRGRWTTEPGVVGGVESTLTVVEAVEVPFAFVAVIVKSVVETGFTVAEPMRVEVLERAPLSMTTDEALLMFQESVEGPAERGRKRERRRRRRWWEPNL